MAVIFFVDDNEEARLMVRRGIEQHGEHIIHEEESFSGAIDFIAQTREDIDLAVIDGTITRRNDGIEIAICLRERFPNALIISHSAASQNWRFGKGYRDYPKPLIFREFIALLDEMFASAT